MFTKEELLASEEYKKWIRGRVVLIHNCYYDSKIPYEAWIVITSTMGTRAEEYTITRFWKTSSVIYVSVDYVEENPEKVFELLLSEYSSGLK